MDPSTITTIIHVTRKVVKYGKITIDYIRDDQTAKLGLLRPVRMTVEGTGVGIGDFQSPDHLFKFLSPTQNRVDFSFEPFPADENSWWNGPDGIPNDWDGGSIPGSLAHDPICKFMRAIAEELGMTEKEVWHWASGILAIVWRDYGGKDSKAKSESWAAYNLTRLLRRPYLWARRRFKSFFMIVAVALVSSGCDSGCLSSPPSDWRLTHGTPVVSIEDGVVTTNTPPTALAE